MTGVKPFERLYRLLVLSLLGLMLGGCVADPVKPWKRGDLARPEMAWEPNPGLSDYRKHAQFSKEAAFGSVGVGGGGCGCN